MIWPSDSRAYVRSSGEVWPLSRPLPAGAVLCPKMLVSKKPAGGIPPDALEQIAGRRLARDVTPEHILRWSDLEEET